jgi:hypothetical protein
MSFILLGIINSQVEAEAAGAYELISTQVLSSTASSVTFSSIPQTYKHLQIRYVARAGDGNSIALQMRLNSDTGTNYATHRLTGNGSSVSSSALAPSSVISLNSVIPADGSTNIFGSGVIDVLDYTNTSKNTTLRSLNGQHNTANSIIGLHSGLYMNTNAITTILLMASSSTFQANSRWSLYGIKG